MKPSLCDELLNVQQNAKRFASFLRAGGQDRNVVADNVAQYVKTHELHARSIRIAERFSLDDDLIVAACQVSENRPSSMIAANAYAILPFQTCWFEWSASAIYRFRYGTDGDVDRTGMLIFCQGTLRRGFMALGYSFLDKRQPATFDPYLMEFDFDSTEMPVSASQYLEFARGSGVHPLVQAAIRSPTEMDALRRVEGLFKGPLIPKIWQRLPEYEQKRLEAASEKNWAGEIVLAHAMLIMLNTKNGTTREQRDVTQINRVRRKQGLRSLLAHSTVHLSRSAATAQRNGTASETTHKGVRAHLVRGHFKVRKSGVFFWSPFLRGDPDLGTKTHDYHVTA